jgi:hypothetical protein
MIIWLCCTLAYRRSRVRIRSTSVPSSLAPTPIKTRLPAATLNGGAPPQIPKCHRYMSKWCCHYLVIALEDGHHSRSGKDSVFPLDANALNDTAPSAFSQCGAVKYVGGDFPPGASAPPLSSSWIREGHKCRRGLPPRSALSLSTRAFKPPSRLRATRWSRRILRLGRKGGGNARRKEGRKPGVFYSGPVDGRRCISLLSSLFIIIPSIRDF